jgi:hypothetical protein
MVLVYGEILKRKFVGIIFNEAIRSAAFYAKNYTRISDV